jgi:hypothetical protein
MSKKEASWSEYGYFALCAWQAEREGRQSDASNYRKLANECAREAKENETK